MSRTASLSASILSLSLLGCDDGSPAAADLGMDAVPPPPDSAPPDAGPAPNIGVWCDPARSDSSGDNPDCIGGARCLVFDDPPRSGMCVVFGCNVDLGGTASVDEESCRLLFGPDFVCVDLDGFFADDGEPYSPPVSSEGQNANLDDNVCVPTCVPRDDGNDCESEFACAPDSTRYNFADAVCLALACRENDDCPTDMACDLLRAVCEPMGLGDPMASVGDPCLSDLDCPPGGSCLTEEDVLDDMGQVVRRQPRNGYCTILGCRFVDTLPGSACPMGTACDHFFFAGGCVRNCDPVDAAGCRANACDPAGALTTGCDWLGDYECLDWSGFAFTAIDLPVVAGDGKICDHLSISGCNDPLDCMGAVSCTDPETGAPSTDGLCLDATGCGPPCSTNGADGAFCRGACVDRDTDVMNCGTCGNACPATLPNCAGGACVP